MLVGAGGKLFIVTAQEPPSGDPSATSLMSPHIYNREKQHGQRAGILCRVSHRDSNHFNFVTPQAESTLVLVVDVLFCDAFLLQQSLLPQTSRQ